MYLLNRENRLNAFPRSTDIIQDLNDLPQVPKNRLLCPTQFGNKKTVYEHFFK